MKGYTCDRCMWWAKDQTCRVSIPMAAGAIGMESRGYDGAGQTSTEARYEYGRPWPVTQPDDWCSRWMTAKDGQLVMDCHAEEAKENLSARVSARLYARAAERARVAEEAAP